MSPYDLHIHTIDLPVRVYDMLAALHATCGRDPLVEALDHMETRAKAQRETEIEEGLTLEDLRSH